MKDLHISGLFKKFFFLFEAVALLFFNKNDGEQILNPYFLSAVIIVMNYYCCLKLFYRKMLM